MPGGRLGGIQGDSEALGGPWLGGIVRVEEAGLHRFGCCLYSDVVCPLFEPTLERLALPIKGSHPRIGEALRKGVEAGQGDGLRLIGCAVKLASNCLLYTSPSPRD